MTPTMEGRVFVGASAGRVDGVDLYLTNGVFLYRVVGVTGSGMGEMVALEDCYRLDVVLVPIADVRARRLRVVTPAAAEN
ncbi:MAG: hypothetical protein ACLP50_30260 [Solirubrobacteraceae bacterium]